ncbi:MAG: hypothetical protein ACYC6G_05405 [Desulfobaccales bacterium]
MTQAKEKSALKRCGAAALMLAIILVGGGSRLQAQVLAVPANMPILYKEIPEYVNVRSRARYKTKLPQCTIAFREDGYYIMSGDREFVILNQNPACLKRFAGKMVAVQGRTTESVVPWCRLYFIAVDDINGMKYDGKVGPWVMREPTDEEIRYWNLHKQLPPATQKFMAYLALPKSASDLMFAGDGAGSDTLAYDTLTAGDDRSLPVADVNRQLTSIQRQLTGIEQKMAKPPYRGIYSVPEEDWNATEWSLYMDSQGGG